MTYLLTFDPSSLVQAIASVEPMVSSVYKSSKALVDRVLASAAEAFGGTSVAKDMQKALHEWVIKKYVPVFTKKDRDNLVQSIVAPLEKTEEVEEIEQVETKQPTETEKASAWSLKGVLGKVKGAAKQAFSPVLRKMVFSTRKVVISPVRKDVEYLIDHAVERMLSEGRLKSIAFNVLTRFNVYANLEMKVPSDDEINTKLRRCKDMILESRYWGGLSETGHFFIQVPLRLAFTKKAFDKGVKALRDQFSHLVAFESDAQEKAAMTRMALEVTVAIVEEISHPALEMQNLRVDQALQQESQKFLKFIQPFLVKEVNSWEAYQKEESEEDLERSINMLDEYGEVAEEFFKNNPLITEYFDLADYGTSSQAIQNRIEELVLQEPEELGDIEIDREIDKDVKKVAGLINRILLSEKTIDLLFSYGVSAPLSIDLWRKLVLENYSKEKVVYNPEKDSIFYKLEQKVFSYFPTFLRALVTDTTE